MEKIKFNDGTRMQLNSISSTATQLQFSVLDEDKNALEALMKDEEKTSVIQLLSVAENTGEETLVKGYAGYTTLHSMSTEYDVVTHTDYSTPDRNTESGFAEETNDVTLVTLRKLTKLESQVDELKESQNLQDGAIEDLATVVSELAEG